MAIQFIGESKDDIRDGPGTGGCPNRERMPSWDCVPAGLLFQSSGASWGRTQLLLQDTYSIKTEVLRH